MFSSGLKALLNHKGLLRLSGPGAGLVFSPDNEDLLMEQILEMKEGDVRLNYGANGRHLVVEKYALEGLGERLVNMYESVR